MSDPRHPFTGSGHPDEAAAWRDYLRGKRDAASGRAMPSVPSEPGQGLDHLMPPPPDPGPAPEDGSLRPPMPRLVTPAPPAEPPAEADHYVDPETAAFRAFMDEARADPAHSWASVQREVSVKVDPESGELTEVTGEEVTGGPRLAPIHRTAEALRAALDVVNAGQQPEPVEVPLEAPEEPADAGNEPAPRVVSRTELAAMLEQAGIVVADDAGDEGEE